MNKNTILVSLATYVVATVVLFGGAAEVIKEASKPIHMIPLQPEFDAPNIFDIIESIFQDTP